MSTRNYSMKPPKTSNKNAHLLVMMLLSLIIVFVEYILIDENSTITTIYQIQLVCVFVIIFYKSFKKFGLFSLISLVLIGFFFFAIGGVFHFLVSNDDIRELASGFGYFVFTNKMIQESLLVYTVYLLITYYSYSIIYSRSRYHINEVEFVSNPRFLIIGQTLMWLFLAIEVYKGYLYFTSFSMDRALIFLNGSNASPIPLWVRFFATFYEIGYLFVIASVPDPKIFKRYSMMYFVVLIPEVLVGNRMQLGIFALYYFWYYSSIYKKQAFKTRTMVFLGVFMLIIFQAIEFYRNGILLQGASFSPTRFLAGQAVSFYLVPLYIMYASQIQYYSYPYFLYNILSGITGYGYNGQSIEVLEHNCGIGHQLMYAINPDVYLAGFSLGSSSVCELYEFGLIGVIIGAFFFALMLYWCEKVAIKYRLGLFLSYTLVGTFVISARGSYFPSVYIIFKYIVFYYLSLIVFSAIIKKNASIDRIL